MMKHDETRSFSARESIRFPHVFGGVYRRAAFRLQPSLRWDVPFVFGAKVFSKRDSIGFQPHQIFRISWDFDSQVDRFRLTIRVFATMMFL
jgi:hypothetical protein